MPTTAFCNLFLMLPPCFCHVFLDRKYAKLSPSWETQCCMEMFVETFQPFSQLTDALSMEKTVSICSVYPLLQHIKESCEKTIDADVSAPLLEASKLMRASIWTYINER